MTGQGRGRINGSRSCHTDHWLAKGVPKVQLTVVWNWRMYSKFSVLLPHEREAASNVQKKMKKQRNVRSLKLSLGEEGKEEKSRALCPSESMMRDMEKFLAEYAMTMWESMTGSRK